MHHNPSKPVACSNHTNTGFSLVELLVVVGIMSVVMFAMLSMVESQRKSLTVFENKISAINLEKNVSVLMSEATSCTSALTFPITFSNPAGSVYNDIELKDKFGSLFLSADTTSVKNKYDKLDIKNIIFTNPNTIAASSSGMAEIMIYLKSSQSTMPLEPITIPIEVQLSAAGQITDCAGGGGAASDWSSMPEGVQCGIFMQTQGTVKADINCQGVNVKTGCPPGFTWANLGYFEAGGGARQFSTCIKD